MYAHTTGQNYVIIARLYSAVNLFVIGITTTITLLRLTSRIRAVSRSLNQKKTAGLKSPTNTRSFNTQEIPTEDINNVKLYMDKQTITTNNNNNNKSTKDEASQRLKKLYLFCIICNTIFIAAILFLCNSSLSDINNGLWNHPYINSDPMHYN
jgi:hypothetical protein